MRKILYILTVLVIIETLYIANTLMAKFDNKSQISNTDNNLICLPKDKLQYKVIFRSDDDVDEFVNVDDSTNSIYYRYSTKEYSNNIYDLISDDTIKFLKPSKLSADFLIHEELPTFNFGYYTYIDDTQDEINIYTLDFNIDFFDNNPLFANKKITFYYYPMCKEENDSCKLSSIDTQQNKYLDGIFEIRILDNDTTDDVVN